MLSFGIQIYENKKERKIGSDPGKGRRLPSSDIPRVEWENRNTQGNNPLVRCNANPMILLLMRVSRPSKLRKTNKKTRERERDVCIHMYTLSHNYTCAYVLMQYYGRL